MRVSRRHWRHAESLFSAHARRRLDQRSRAHRSARHACCRRSRRGSWSVRRPRGQGAAEARAEGGRLVFYTPSHRPAPLATACTAASSPGGRNGALGASHQRRGRRRGSGRREAVDRAEAVGRARERPERPERPEARAGRRLPIGRAPWTRRARHSRSAGQKKTKRHAYAAARCEAPPGGQMESGPRGRGAGRRRHALHRLVETPAAGVHAKPIANGSSTSSLFFVRLGVELWGILGRPEASC